jgi:hypothetical protein
MSATCCNPPPHESARTVGSVSWWHRKRSDNPPHRRPRGAELDALFGPSRKHIHERKEWVAIAKVDDRVSGDDPIIDLTEGTAILPPRESRGGRRR